MDTLNIKCGQCGHINELQANWDQLVAFCVKCGHKIPVPLHQDAQADVVEDLSGDDEVGFAEQARQSEGRKVNITCSKCGKTVTVSARVAGRKARCKACDAPMDIPYPDDLAQAELPRPRNGAKETGLDLEAPGEMSALGRGAAPPDDRESMLDLLPEPIHAADDEGTHEPLPVVIPLSQHAAPAALHHPPHHPPHRRPANGARGAPQEAPTPKAAVLAGIEALSQLPPQASPGQGALAQGLGPQEQIHSPDVAQLAIAVQDFHAGREAVLARRRRAARLRSGIYLAVGTVVCSSLAGLAVMLWPVIFPQQQHVVDITDRAPRTGAKGGPATPTVGKHAVGVTPATHLAAAPTTGDGTGKTINTSPQPPPSYPRCDVAVLGTTFGPGGYYPAALGSIYWKMTARIRAAAEPISFRAMGKDVQLAFGDKTVDSLGIPEDSTGGGGLLPRLARQETISIQPGQSRQVTLLFEVPVEISKYELIIGKLKWPFTIRSAIEPIAAASLTATFVEAAPRNLRPMLADPVMSAIQSAGQQQLAVRPRAGGLEVVIPEAQVSGLATPAGPDVYGVGLSYGEYKLAANLRFVDGGRTAILYLADKPFHQITYINPSAPRPPEPPAPTDSPTTATGKTPDSSNPDRDHDKIPYIPPGKGLFDMPRKH